MNIFKLYHLIGFIAGIVSIKYGICCEATGCTWKSLEVGYGAIFSPYVVEEFEPDPGIIAIPIDRDLPNSRDFKIDATSHLGYLRGSIGFIIPTTVHWGLGIGFLFSKSSSFSDEQAEINPGTLGSLELEFLLGKSRVLGFLIAGLGGWFYSGNLNNGGNLVESDFVPNFGLGMKYSILKNLSLKINSRVYYLGGDPGGTTCSFDHSDGSYNYYNCSGGERFGNRDKSAVGGVMLGFDWNFSKLK